MTSEHGSITLLWYHKQVMRATVQTALGVTACSRVWATFAVAQSTTDHNQQYCLPLHTATRQAGL